MKAKSTFPKTLVYVKKMQVFSNAASILQTLNMAWAFQGCGLHVKLYPSAVGPQEKIVAELKIHHDLNSNNTPDFNFIHYKNKGFYGLHFRWSILKEWMSSEQKLFFVRDINEGIWISFLKKYMNKNHLFVYEMHDSTYLEFLNAKKIDDKTKKEKEKKVLHAADAIIYTGVHLKQIVDDLYAPSAPNFVAPPGYNPKIFTQLKEKENKSSSRELAYFGTLFPGKGVDVFLDALAVLPREFSGSIIGGNPESRLEALRLKALGLGLGERVRFWGQVSPHDIPKTLANADAIVIPFQTPTEFLSPIKLYESLALGLPIIATPMPALVELSKTLKSIAIADGCGHIAFAECVHRIFSDKEKVNSMLQYARKREGVQNWDERAASILYFMKSVFI